MLRKWRTTKWYDDNDRRVIILQNDDADLDLIIAALDHWGAALKKIGDRATVTSQLREETLGLKGYAEDLAGRLRKQR